MNRFLQAGILILLLLAIATIALLMQGEYVTQHENAHKQIGIMHGCVDYNLEANLFEGNFTCYSYRTLAPGEHLQEQKLQAWNEIIGYHFIISMWAFFIGIIVISSAIILHGTITAERPIILQRPGKPDLTLRPKQ